MTNKFIELGRLPYHDRRLEKLIFFALEDKKLARMQTSVKTEIHQFMRKHKQAVNTLMPENGMMLKHHVHRESFGRARETRESVNAKRACPEIKFCVCSPHLGHGVDG